MASWVEGLGSWNPQFLRECRGRLKPRSVFAAVGLSLIFQFLLFISSIDTSEPVPPEDFGELCQSLSWIIPYALFVLGGYYIVEDLGKEEKTGTLNFIRLSPRPAVEILTGKLMGAPLLPVILVAASVPLHVISGLLGGVSLLWLLSYYVTVIFTTVLVYSLALLFGLVGSTSPLGKQQALSAIGFAGLALFFFSPAFMLWSSQSVWWTFGPASPLFRELGQSGSPMEWLYLPIAGNVGVAHLFLLGNVVLATLIVWQILLRKFRIPQATLLSKRISYIGVAYLNVLVWGFFQSNAMPDYSREGGAIALILLNIGLFTGLIFALAPARQTLIDWMRYRKHSVADWIWSDSSPSFGAIAINLIIAAALVVPSSLVMLQNNDYLVVPVLLAALSFMTAILIYATIVQLIFSMRLRSPFVWAAGVVATLAFVPPITLGILTDGINTRSTVLVAIWTFLGLPFTEGSESGNIAMGIILGWIPQLVVLAILFFKLKQNLKKLSPKPSVSV